MVDDFIGRTFGVDNQVEVIEKGGASGAYVVRCSECAKDSELFGVGTFKARKYDLLRGQLPCGCSKVPKWSEAQQMIRVRRVCAENGNIAFLGIVGKFMGNKTKLQMRCLIDGHEWEVLLNNLISKNNGCPKCKARKVGETFIKPDEVMIESFMTTGSFLQGTVFCRSDKLDSFGRKGFWKYTCPVCSEDEYVQAGVCTGVFEAHCTSLQAGQRSCRCSKNYIWTGEQREYQVQRAIHSEGLNYRFLGFIEDSSALLRVWCNEHKLEFNPSIKNFINRGSRCPSCAKHGFDPSKIGHLYVMHVEGASVEFTGYGISNVVADRLATHRKTFSDNALTITDIKLFEGCGQEVLDMENKLRETFDSNKIGIAGFKRENTHSHLYNSVVDFIRGCDTLSFCDDI